MFKILFTNVPHPRAAPWGLAGSGLGGETRVLDIGGVPFLMPSVQKEKL